MRVRLNGNANRALDLVKLEASYVPTGGNSGVRATKQTTLWDGSPTNNGPKDQTGLGIQVWWDNRDTHKQINIAIPFLEIGDAEDLSYYTQLRVCDIGTKTREQVAYDADKTSWDFCDVDGSFVESAAFNNARVLRRRVLQDDSAGEGEALVQVPGATTSFTNCGSEATGDFDQACYDAYVAEVNQTPTPVVPVQEVEETGSSLVVAIAAVVVVSVVIGAGAIMYSKGMFGGNANKDQAPT
jgi:hypothetical protein